MKKIVLQSVPLLVLLFCLVFNSAAQVPEGITYQAEARDNKGKILDNKSLTIRAILLNGATASATVWTKDYTVKTDDYGLFSIVLGDGAGESAFASINWGNGKY